MIKLSLVALSCCWKLIVAAVLGFFFWFSFFFRFFWFVVFCWEICFSFWDAIFLFLGDVCFLWAWWRVGPFPGFFVLRVTWIGSVYLFCGIWCDLSIACNLFIISLFWVCLNFSFFLKILSAFSSFAIWVFLFYSSLFFLLFLFFFWFNSSVISLLVSCWMNLRFFFCLQW